MAKVAPSIARGQGRWRPAPPGLVARIGRYAPRKVIHLAERRHGHQVAPSSVRDCLQEAATRADNPAGRLGYGHYRPRTAAD